MAIIRWHGGNDPFSQLDPFTQLERMQRDMESLLTAYRSRGSGRRGYRAGAFPPMNIYNDGESFIVRAELPGVAADKLDLEVKGDTLTLRGQREAPEVPENASYHRRERDYGQFRRSFTLPDQVDSNKVVATFSDGILEVRLPHAEQAKRRKITVKSS